MPFAAQGDAARAWELADLINPVSHALTPAQAAPYKVEPYVMAADVYALAPHVGRGGWTWYTGSAGWMLRLYVESLLGFSRTGNTLRFAPCWHPGWCEFKWQHRFHETMYRIVVRPGSAALVAVDGLAQPGAAVTLVDDRRDHAVEVSIVAGGAAAATITPG